MCAWIKVGETALCGKSFCGTYCKIHLEKFRKGSKIPVRCRSCGKGVQSDIQVFRDCGREKIRHRRLALERTAKNNFTLVLEQLLAIRTEMGLAYGKPSTMVTHAQRARALREEFQRETGEWPPTPDRGSLYESYRRG